MGLMDVPFMVLALLALADAALLGHLHMRRERRIRNERMASSLRSALRRDIGRMLPQAG